jgi:chromosome segregation ATPase
MAVDLNAAQTAVAEFRVDALAICDLADALIADVTGLNNQVTDLQTTNQTQTNLIASLQSDLANANQAKADAEANVADLQAQVTQLEAQVADLQAQLDALTPPPTQP